MTQRLLVVDDEPHILVLFERIINEKTNYGITTTSNPLEVFDILDRERYDVVVTDFKMHGMNGIELLRKIKERGGGEEVIIITAYGSLESATEALAEGVFDYITKPFRKEHILHTIDRAMRLQGIRRELVHLRRIFAAEPHEKARKLFDEEYIRKLAERTNGDSGLMAERSGLSREYIKSVMDSAGSDNGVDTH